MMIEFNKIGTGTIRINQGIFTPALGKFCEICEINIAA
jgi:hypothetical protein